MKIVLIIKYMPTPDNFKGGSAHPYHLIKYRPKDIDLEVYSFNTNDVNKEWANSIEKELNTKIHLVETPRWIKFLVKFHLVFLKNFLAYPLGYYYKLTNKIIKEIKSKKPDGIWIWGDDESDVAKKFEGFKRVMTMPDCLPMYYNRLLADPWAYKNLFRLVGLSIQNYKNVKMEQAYPSKDIKYHLVGEADRLFLKNFNPKISAHFIHHPVYNYADKKEIKFSEPKIKILLAGQYNLYMKSAFDAILPELCKHNELTKYYDITFLGTGWENAAENLRKVGYKTKQINFVDVYLDEIIKYDIQLTPISVGTGTKGKVLDGLANGLLVIGTPYAMENIAVENEKSCIIYENTEQLISTLKKIPNRRDRYENIALEGRKQVLKWHNRQKVSEQVFSLFT